MEILSILKFSKYLITSLIISKYTYFHKLSNRNRVVFLMHFLELLKGLLVISNKNQYLKLFAHHTESNNNLPSYFGIKFIL